MINNIFLDTNIIIYAYKNDNKEKNDIAVNVLQTKTENIRLFISVQSVNEFISALIKKNYQRHTIKEYVNEIINSINIFYFDFDIIDYAIDIKFRYNFSYFDSLLLATAIQHNCSIFYTEDLQHNQIIENKIKIINPFMMS